MQLLSPGEEGGDSPLLDLLGCAAVTKSSCTQGRIVHSLILERCEFLILQLTQFKNNIARYCSYFNNFKQTFGKFLVQVIILQLHVILTLIADGPQDKM